MNFIRGFSKAKVSVTVYSLMYFMVGFLDSSIWAGPHGTLAPRKFEEILGIQLPSISAPRAPKKMLYYGGPVISHVKTYAVFWGSNVNATTKKQISSFLTAVVDSNHMDWLSQYATNIKAVDGRDGTQQTIGRGKHLGEFQITPRSSSNRIDDKDIQAEIENQIANKVLPAPDADTLYMIYFPPGASITIEGMSSCQAFCAYHMGFVSQSYGNIYYGVMPDLGGACAFGCGFQNTPFDSLTAISSHELIEAVTDPFPTPADKPAYPQAWNFSDGNEIGDVCSQYMTRLTGGSVTYVLQQEWDNASGRCAPGPYQF